MSTNWLSQSAIQALFDRIGDARESMVERTFQAQQNNAVPYRPAQLSMTAGDPGFDLNMQRAYPVDVSPILSIRGPDIGNALRTGMELRQMQTEYQQGNVLRGLIAEHGPDLMDPGPEGDAARAALAGIDPAMVADLNSTLLSQQATRQDMDLAERRVAGEEQEREARIAELWAAADLNEMERDHAALAYSYAQGRQSGDWSLFEREKVRLGVGPEITPENYPAVASQFESALSALGHWTPEPQPEVVTGAQLAERHPGLSVEDPSAGFVIEPGGQPSLMEGTGTPEPSEPAPQYLTGAQLMELFPGAQVPDPSAIYRKNEDGFELVDGTGAPQAPEGPTFRPATPEEAAANGAQAGQIDTATGRFYPNDPPDGFRIDTRPDGTTTIVQGDVGEQDRARIDPASVDAMIGTIDGILTDPAMGWSTGAWSWLQRVPGTPMRRFGARARQLEGQAFLQAFESLMGGGAITEVEGLKATQAMGRLDTAQSEADYRAALTELREILATAQARIAGQEPIPGPGAPAVPPPASTTPAPADLSDDALIDLYLQGGSR